VRVSVSCAASCARQRARWARFGVCGVKVCSRQLLKENLIIPAWTTIAKYVIFFQEIHINYSIEQIDVYSYTSF